MIRLPSTPSCARYVALWMLALSACIPLPHGHEVSSRRVTDKLNGDTFVADDGSWCRVPEATYRKVAPGADHVCIWKKGPAGLAGGGSRGIPGL